MSADTEEEPPGSRLPLAEPETELSFPLLPQADSRATDRAQARTRERVRRFIT